jgi:hypothetical protein
VGILAQHAGVREKPRLRVKISLKGDNHAKSLDHQHGQSRSAIRAAAGRG